MKIHNFSAGPSILAPEVMQQAAAAVVNLDNSGLSILEISHRSTAFLSILAEAKSLVLELLNLSASEYKVLFLQGGASMEFLRIPMNLMQVNGKAAYLNTGTWADKAIEEAKAFGTVIEVASSKPHQFNHIPKKYTIPQDVDYFHCTSNNTIYGTQMHAFPKMTVPMVCDMSSDIFSRMLDFSQFDLIYAGAQKNIGPAGTTLVVVNEKILNKTQRQLPNIMNYQMQINHESMYNTPAVFAIYTSMLTLRWLKEKGGIPAIEKSNKEKAALLYDEIDQNALFEGTAVAEDRSLMNVCFKLKEEKHTAAFDALCVENGISGLKGHRTVGGYRASIYNAMPLSSVQALVAVMQLFKKSLAV